MAARDTEMATQIKEEPIPIDEYEEDLEELRKAALQTIRPKPLPNSSVPVPVAYRLPSPPTPFPQVPLPHTEFLTHCVNPNLIAIVPVSDRPPLPQVARQPFVPPYHHGRGPRFQLPPSVARASVDQKFGHSSIQASVAEEQPSVPTKFSRIDASDSESDDDILLKKNNSSDEEDEEEEQGGSDNKSNATGEFMNLEDEDSLERLMEVMEQEMIQNTTKKPNKKKNSKLKKEKKLKSVEAPCVEENKKPKEFARHSEQKTAIVEPTLKETEPAVVRIKKEVIDPAYEPEAVNLPGPKNTILDKVISPASNIPLRVRSPSEVNLQFVKHVVPPVTVEKLHVIESPINSSSNTVKKYSSSAKIKSPSPLKTPCSSPVEIIERRSLSPITVSNSPKSDGPGLLPVKEKGLPCERKSVSPRRRFSRSPEPYSRSPSPVRRKYNSRSPDRYLNRSRSRFRLRSWSRSRSRSRSWTRSYSRSRSPPHYRRSPYSPRRYQTRQARSRSPSPRRIHSPSRPYYREPERIGLGAEKRSLSPRRDFSPRPRVLSPVRKRNGSMSPKNSYSNDSYYAPKGPPGINSSVPSKYIPPYRSRVSPNRRTSPSYTIVSPCYSPNFSSNCSTSSSPRGVTSTLYRCSSPKKIRRSRSPSPPRRRLSSMSPRRHLPPVRSGRSPISPRRRSPISPRRAQSPRGKRVSPKRSPLPNQSRRISRSPSPMHLRRLSPRKNSISPRRTQLGISVRRSPILHERHVKRRSFSPRSRIRSISPTRKLSRSPINKRKFSPRKNSRSPIRKRLSSSPRKSSKSPKRLSVSPRRDASPRRFNNLAKSRRLSVSPRRTAKSPKRLSVSPRRDASPRRFNNLSKSRRMSISPQRIPFSSKLRRNSVSPRRSEAVPYQKRRSNSPRRRSSSPKRRILPRAVAEPAAPTKSFTASNRSPPRKTSPLHLRHKRPAEEWRTSRVPGGSQAVPRQATHAPAIRSHRSMSLSLSPSPGKETNNQSRARSPHQDNLEHKTRRRNSPHGISSRDAHLKRRRDYGDRHRERDPRRRERRRDGDRDKERDRPRDRTSAKEKEEEKKRHKDADKKEKTEEEKQEKAPVNTDPVMEARKRKFESKSLVQPDNRKICLKKTTEKECALPQIGMEDKTCGTENAEIDELEEEFRLMDKACNTDDVLDLGGDGLFMEEEEELLGGVFTKKPEMEVIRQESRKKEKLVKSKAVKDLRHKVTERRAHKHKSVDKACSPLVISKKKKASEQLKSHPIALKVPLKRDPVKPLKIKKEVIEEEEKPQQEEETEEEEMKDQHEEDAAKMEEEEINAVKEKEECDLRAELSRRRAERLTKAGSLDESLPKRLVQSAFYSLMGGKGRLESKEKKSVKSTRQLPQIQSQIQSLPQKIKKERPVEVGQRRVLLLKRSAPRRKTSVQISFPEESESESDELPDYDSDEETEADAATDDEQEEVELRTASKKRNTNRSALSRLSVKYRLGDQPANRRSVKLRRRNQV